MVVITGMVAFNGVFLGAQCLRPAHRVIGAIVCSYWDQLCVSDGVQPRWISFSAGRNFDWNWRLNRAVISPDHSFCANRRRQ